jgi:serine/threonine-protein kinase
LPFENLGPPEEDHFADGITQEITSRLAAVSGLRVISRTSATYYRNREVPLRQIGEELDVSYVLEGSIRRERAEEGHGRVRVCPQLIRVSDDSHLWSHRYDRELEDIFSIQSDIAEEVLVHIRAMLLEPERELVETQPTENMDAYQAYLAGVQYLESTEEERFLNLGAEMLERAVELDPDFAVAHAKLSEAHSVIYHFRYDFTSVRLEMARAAADRALQLQPDLPEGHRALGWHYYFCQRDYERALAEFAVAAERLPNDSNLQLGIFFVQRRRGNWEEALQALERIQLIDPRGYFAALESMITYGILREFERAEVEMNRAISIAPDHADAYFYGIVIYLRWDGSTDRARSLMASAPSLDSPRMNYFSVLLDMYDRKPEQALARLDELSIDVINLDDRYRPRALLECICLSQMGERSRAEEACASAVALLESELEMRPHDFRLHSAIGHAYALLGRKKDAVAAGERSVDLLPVSQDIIAGSDQAIELAKIYAQVSETEKALDLIEQLLANPGGFLIGPFTTDPVWDPLRDHPRFQALLEKYETQAN